MQQISYFVMAFYSAVALILTRNFMAADTKEYPLQPAAFNSKRDLFEMGLFTAAVQAKIPVLGICRGLQLINISLGGKLVLDIESTGKPNHRAMNGVDHIHQVELDPASQLAAITGCSLGTINSAHHQPY